MAAPIPPRPNRLVYLLDHEYTQRGLNWSRLKGVDAERAALLRAAAERAGCQAVLALAEVKETWDAWPSGSDPRDDYDYYDDEDEDDEAEDYGYHDASRDRGGDHDDYQLNELIDDEITLGWWTSPDGMGGEPISLHVPDSEVCATTPSADLTPCQSEYEGYMGNYGNTLDRWYRRAAVVVWARDRVETAAPEHADGLAAAAGQYGEEWTRGVIDGWFRSEHYFETDRYQWVERLPGLCGALRTAGAPEAARLLAAGAWSWMGDQLRMWTITARAGSRQPQLGNAELAAGTALGGCGCRNLCH